MKETSVWRTNALNKSIDLLAVEEPMQIILDIDKGLKTESEDIAVTMRTPGHDFELATGFLYTEGLINKKSDILALRYCENVADPAEKDNVVRVVMNPAADIDISTLKRNFYMTSSCGICGKSSIQQVRQQCREMDNFHKFKLKNILASPLRLRQKQYVFEHTGGIHACGLFDRMGNLQLLREDVGRHNALDKLIGAALSLDWIPASDKYLVVSGRASFELVQKAVIAGIPLMAAVGAPSSMAVELARSTGMTLMGFVRQNEFNIYCGKERILT